MHWGENDFRMETFLVLCTCIFTRSCISFHYFFTFTLYFQNISWKRWCLKIRILLQKKIHPIFKVLNSLPKNFLYFFPHLPLLLMSCYVLENLCENLSFFLRIFMLWINWFQCQNDSKSEKFFCRHDFSVSSHTLFFFSFLFNWFVLFSFVFFCLFLGCTQLRQASTDTICCFHLSH